MQNRFGDKAKIVYVDTSVPANREQHATQVMRVHDDKLIYPVTFIDGEPVYDGAVSYPAILRQVQNKLAVAES